MGITRAVKFVTYYDDVMPRYEGMTARTALAVIDHNSNLNRAQVSNMIDIVMNNRWLLFNNSGCY